VDGELRGDLCLELERHLADCEDCKIVVDTLKKTIYLIHANERVETVPADVRERLYKCLDLNEFLEA
jgi:adenosine deaminase